jgi:hypothetical protein
VRVSLHGFTSCLHIVWELVENRGITGFLRIVERSVDFNAFSMST